MDYMIMAKYVIDYNDSTRIGMHTVYRVIAASKFYLNPEHFVFAVTTGSVGGWIESEENLSQDGCAWVGDGASVWGSARVRDEAVVYGSAHVYDHAIISGGARVHGSCTIFGNATISDDAEVKDNVVICGKARVLGESRVIGVSTIDKNAMVSGNAVVRNSLIGGSAWICGTADINNKEIISGIEDGKELEFDEYEDSDEDS
jgi:UDP-3-O-[3-hydroxymyristoyl] glucosamine N-acyltransferase